MLKRFFLLTLAVSCFIPMLRAQDDVVIDRVVGVVGQNIIKLSDIEGNYAQVRMHQGASNAHENRCKIFESLLLSKLLIHKGLIDSVEVKDEDVETQVDGYMKQYLLQFGSKEALRQAMGYSYDEIHDILFDMTKDRAMSERVEYNLTQNVKMTPGEVAEYFNSIPQDSIPTIEDEYEVSEIAILPIISDAERDRVRLELNRLRERVLNGENFGMLATLYSQDPVSAKKGGELGFFARGTMVGEFEAAAFSLKPGEVSPVIETEFGFHIIQLIERRGNTLNARHILISPKVQAEDMLKTRVFLDSLAQEIRLGHISFDDAAKEYSQVPSKTQGGVMINPATGNSRFSKDVFGSLYSGISIAAMEVGEVSSAVAMKNDEGKDVYRIVTVKKKIAAHKANLVDDYDKIFSAALQNAKNNKIQEWASRMIKNTYIHISDDYKDCDYQLDWLGDKK